MTEPPTPTTEPDTTERQKALNGELFICNDAEINDIIAHARSLTELYNTTPFAETARRKEILTYLFGHLGNNVIIDKPFYCDYGCNISIGDNVIIGINCSFVDCNRITIGNKVLIASNVHICTATHPIETGQRIIPDWDPASGTPWFRTYAKPVTIGDEAWIGAHATILPGVTIGKRTVIGAGSLVNKDIPDDCVAAGNPCRILRRLTPPVDPA